MRRRVGAALATLREALHAVEGASGHKEVLVVLHCFCNWCFVAVVDK